VFGKDQAKADLVAYTRLVVRSVQGCITLTDQQRQGLGITIRANPTRIAKPEGKPYLGVLAMKGRRLKLSAHEGGTARRGKPDRVAGMNVYYVIAEQLPEGPDDWALLTRSSWARCDVTLPAAVTPGKTVWLAAQWFNPRSQAGPVGTAIAVTVGAVGVRFKSSAAWTARYRPRGVPSRVTASQRMRGTGRRVRRIARR